MFARVASFEGGDTEKLREMNQQRMQGEDIRGVRTGIDVYQVVFDDQT